MRYYLRSLKRPKIALKVCLPALSPTLVKHKASEKPADSFTRRLWALLSAWALFFYFSKPALREISKDRRGFYCPPPKAINMSPDAFFNNKPENSQIYPLSSFPLSSGMSPGKKESPGFRGKRHSNLSRGKYRLNQ